MDQDKIIILLVKALEQTIEEISDETLMVVNEIIEEAQKYSKKRPAPKLKVMAEAA